MDHLGLTLLSLFVVLFALVSKRLETSPITAPMVFAGVGLVLGPLGFGLIELDAESNVLHILAEVTLGLVLFADASTIDIRILRRNFSLPLRLLGVGLPLTIATGALAAQWLFPQLDVWQAALIGAILAPTDAALGQAVVTSEKVPGRIRQALNVESGLNDGICLPFVMMFLALAAGGAPHPGAYWAQYAAAQLILGPLVGVLVGWLGGKALGRAAQAGWINENFERLSSVALALLAFCCAEMIGGNGFIATFVGGLVFGNTAGNEVWQRALTFAEAEGQLLGLLAFLAFGSASIAPALTTAGLAAVIYAVLSLTALRMIPVSLSLAGTGLGLRSHMFLGWFGPRGLASILYVLLAVEETGLGAKEEIYAVVMCTVLLSVLLHGLTAAPAAAAYAAHSDARIAAEPSWAGGHPVDEMPFRRPFRG